MCTTKSKFLLTVIFLFISITAVYSQKNDGQIILPEEFDFSGLPVPAAQYYKLESKLISYFTDGKIKSINTFILKLKCDHITGKHTCLKFIINTDDNKQVEIPDLEGWSYDFQNGIDENNNVFGIDHKKFDNLKDNLGNVVSPGIAYHIFNSFIDFHSFVNVFAQKTEEGKGIQDLSEIGQKIVHSSAYSEPPVNLGENVSTGSYFKNGKITLEFTGVSYFDENICALISFDSGESSFKMIMEPAPDFTITTLGRSRYCGTIFRDIKTNVVRKVSMIESVVSETRMPKPHEKNISFTERNIAIINESGQ